MEELTPASGCDNRIPTMLKAVLGELAARWTKQGGRLSSSSARTATRARVTDVRPQNSARFAKKNSGSGRSPVLLRLRSFACRTRAFLVDKACFPGAIGTTNSHTSPETVTIDPYCRYIRHRIIVCVGG